MRPPGRLPRARGNRARAAAAARGRRDVPRPRHDHAARSSTGGCATRGSSARTSQPPPADFREVYGALAAHGTPVRGDPRVGRPLGHDSAARAAAASLRDQAGCAPVEVVDSRARVRRAGSRRARRRPGGRPGRQPGRGRPGGGGRGRAGAPPRRRAVPRLPRPGREGDARPAETRPTSSASSPSSTLDAAGRARPGGAARGFPRACVKLVEKSLKTAAGVAAPVFAVGPRRRRRPRGADRRRASGPAARGRGVRRGGHARARGPRRAGRGGRRDPGPGSALTQPDEVETPDGLRRV